MTDVVFGSWDTVKVTQPPPRAARMRTKGMLAKTQRSPHVPRKVRKLEVAKTLLAKGPRKGRKAKGGGARSARTAKQRASANSAHGRARATARAFHQARRAASSMWLLRMALKAVAKTHRARRPDGRSHGAKGVRKKGKTGLAGR